MQEWQANPQSSPERKKPADPVMFPQVNTIIAADSPNYHAISSYCF